MAGRLLGKHLLVGLTYLNDDGTVDRLEQLHGEVVRADEEGVSIELASGGFYWLPPDLRSFRQAAPGEYRLRSTGEVVIDPDYITDWTVTPGKDG
jgi:hypothetical protein